MAHSEWLKLLRELGSLALVAYALVFGLNDLKQSIDRLADSSERLQSEIRLLVKEAAYIPSKRD